jgi:SAM-dependent methyltransferase
VTPHILNWLQTVKGRWSSSPASILEIGSRDVNGSPRSVWTGCQRYIGVDLEAGPGVDVVADAHTLDLQEQFGLILCCEMLEHDTDPMATVAACRRHLSPGGILIITTPANGFPDHKYPKDYWRFMPDAYADLFFVGMNILEVVRIEGPTLCGVAATV